MSQGAACVAGEPEYAVVDRVWVKEEPTCVEQESVCVKEEVTFYDQESICVKEQATCTEPESICVKEEPICSEPEPVHVKEEPMCVIQEVVHVQPEALCVKDIMSRALQVVRTPAPRRTVTESNHRVRVRPADFKPKVVYGGQTTLSSVPFGATASREGATNAVQSGATGTVQSGATSAVQSGATSAVQSGAITAVQSGATSAFRATASCEGATSAVQSGATSAMQSGATSAVQSGATSAVPSRATWYVTLGHDTALATSRLAGDRQISDEFERALAMKQLKSLLKVKSKTEKYFYCLTCQKQYKTVDALNKHNNIHRKKTNNRETATKYKARVNPAKSYCCEICKKKYNNLVDFKLHQEDHMQPTPLTNLTSTSTAHPVTPSSFKNSYNCDKCTAVFDDLHELTVHAFNTHAKLERPYTCPICLKEFATRRGFKMHERFHMKYLTYCCRYCKERFMSIADLCRHKSINHYPEGDLAEG